MNKTIKNLNLVLILGLISQVGIAQVKVGNNPTTINSNSVLEIESTDKGLLLPRVALSATSSATPLSAHVAGMVVYNTATAGTAPNEVMPGYYYNDGAKWVRVADAAATPVNIYNANGTLTGNRTVTQGGNALNFAGTGVTTFNSGNVGIGTLLPTAKLQVVDGDVRIDNDQRYVVSGSGSLQAAGSNTSILALNSTTGLAFETNSSERMIINNTGNVGIGTPTPTQLLDVHGNITNRGLYMINSIDGNYAGHITSTNEAITQNGIQIHAARGAGKIVFSTNEGGAVTERMRITQAGNVGIGTSTPVGKFQVVSTSGNFFSIDESGANVITPTNVQIGLGDNSVDPDAALDFHTAGNTAVPALFDARILRASGLNSPLHIVQAGTGNISFHTGSDGVSAVGGTTAFTMQNGPGARATSSGGFRVAGGGTSNFGGTYITWNDANLGGSGNGFTGFLNHRGTGAGGFVFSGTNDNTSFQEYLRIAANGNVGIGTAAPAARLSVDLGTAGSVNVATPSGLAGLIYFSPSGNRADVRRSDDRLELFVSSTSSAPGATGIMIENNGNVGIGIVNATHILHINGQGRATNSAWATTSDRRLKENIKEYSLGINELMKIKTYEYNYKAGVENLTKEEQEKRRVGIMAQEIEKILPRTVTTIQENGLPDQRLFNNDELIYLLINSVKDQQKQIEELKTKLENLNKK